MRYNFGVGMFELGDFSGTGRAHFRETPMNRTIPIIKIAGDRVKPTYRSSSLPLTSWRYGELATFRVDRARGSPRSKRSYSEGRACPSLMARCTSAAKIL